MVNPLRKGHRQVTAGVATGLLKVSPDFFSKKKQENPE